MRFLTLYNSGVWVPLKPFTFIQALLSGNVYSWKIKFNCGDTTNDPAGGIPTREIKVKFQEIY